MKNIAHYYYNGFEEDIFLQTKSNNLYKVSKDTYSKLLQDNITKSYKKSNVSVINNINKEAKVIAAELKLDDRIEQFNQREVFVTLKDHKVNFQKDLKRRLINPAKSLRSLILNLSTAKSEKKHK